MHVVCSPLVCQAWPVSESCKMPGVRGDMGRSEVILSSDAPRRTALQLSQAGRTAYGTCFHIKVCSWCRAPVGPCFLADGKFCIAFLRANCKKTHCTRATLFASTFGSRR